VLSVGAGPALGSRGKPSAARRRFLDRSPAPHPRAVPGFFYPRRSWLQEKPHAGEIGNGTAERGTAKAMEKTRRCFDDGPCPRTASPIDGAQSAVPPVMGWFFWLVRLLT